MSLSLFAILILSKYMLAITWSPTPLHPIFQYSIPLFVPERLSEYQAPLMPREDRRVGLTINKRQVLSSAGLQDTYKVHDVVSCSVQ